MTTGRESPLGVCNFLVRVALLGPRGGRGDERELAFSEVVFPPLRLDRSPVGDDPDPRIADQAANLVLRRGHTGSHELYEWWRAERDAERLRVREVTVVLLDETHRPVTAWRFTGCRVSSLEYTPLDALDSGVLMESLELSFKAVEQFGVGN